MVTIARIDTSECAYTRITCAFEPCDVRVTKDSAEYLLRRSHLAFRLLTVTTVVLGSQGDFYTPLSGAFNQMVHLSEYDIAVSQTTLLLSNDPGSFVW